MCDGLLDRLEYAALWIRFLAAEHGSMSMRILILVLSPALPMWIRDEMMTLEHRTSTSTTLKTRGRPCSRCGSR